MRAVLRPIIAFFGAAFLLLAAAILEGSPAIGAANPPSPQDIANARTLVHRVRAATREPSDEPQTIRIDAATMNASLRMGARMLPGFRGTAEVEDGQLMLRGALPLWRDSIWINVEAAVPSDTEGLVLDHLTLGRLTLPSSMALPAATLAADLALGRDASAQLFSGLQGVDVSDTEVAVRLDMTNESRGEIVTRAFGALRGGDMPSAEAIAEESRAIRAAVDAGRLPDRGSVLPHLRFALERAASAPAKQRPNAYTAAIFGLSDACGAKDFAPIVDHLIDDYRHESETWTRSCKKVTLSGRVDTRLHFLASAALQAASNRGVAVSIGEFKELYDIGASGGFDFTDMAADLAGVRLSDRLMTAEEGAWPHLLATIKTEESVMVPLAGIPGRMSGKTFRERYGSVDSDAYRTELDRIEARIDALPLHTDPPS